MDDDDRLPQMHDFDRVPVPAILIQGSDGLSVRSATAFGIFDPIVVPVVFGADAAAMMGDCFTENLTGVFEPDDDGAEGFGDVMQDNDDQAPDPGGSHA